MAFLKSELFILIILFVIIAVSEWLVKRPVFKQLGTALLVILITAIVANLGLIPSASDAPPLYGHIFKIIAPLSIFYLLLDANFSVIRKAGLPLLLLFLLGSAGTTIGAIAGGHLINGTSTIGNLFAPLAGMFTGTYSGGSVNFNAVAIHYNVQEEGNLYAGAVAIDNIITALWMIVTLAAPKILGYFFPRHNEKPSRTAASEDVDSFDTVSLNPISLSILVALGMLTLLCSETLSNVLLKYGISIPSILILTSISLILAQFKWVAKMEGSRLLGIIGIYLFLAIIGAYCELSTLPAIGMVAIYLLLFALIMVIIHGIILFGIGGWMNQDWDLIAIASQANVGGSGSALALAKSLERGDLLLPAILLGTLGNALGTYLGFMVVQFF